MRRFEICLVSQQFGEVRSGVGIYTRNVARRLLQDGHGVTLICPREHLSHDLPGLDLYPVSGQKTGSSHIRWLMLSRRFGKAIEDILDQKRCHLIHFTDAREVLFCPRRDVPLVGNMNDYYFATAPSNPLVFRADYVDWPLRWAYYNVVRHLEGGALRKLTAVICNSHHTKNVLSAEYHLPADKLHVIYKSIDISKYTFQPRLAEGPHHRILFIGGNVQRKGLPTLIRSAPAVLAAFPQTEFLVVGDNQNLGAMKNLCLRVGVAPHFHFLGWQSHDQIADHYRRAGVFVMPSLIEAFGVVFLEAMASGVPVVGGDVGGTRELIQNGVNGFLVKPRDHQGLAEKIISLLQDEGIRQRLIANGSETAERYGVGNMLEETYRLYQRLLS